MKLPLQKTLLFFATYLMTYTAVAGDAKLQELFDHLTPKFQQTMILCPEKIWPNYNWKNVNVFLLESGQPSQVWHGQNNLVEVVNNDVVPAASYQGTYDFFNWNNRSAIALNPKNEPYFLVADNLFGLAVHEGFHNIGQASWKQKNDSSRGTAYPVDFRPRLYRYMMNERLKSYFLSQGSEKNLLAQAAYWFKRWVQEFPEETQSTTDGYEGTAAYVEYIAGIYANNGCNASEISVLASLQNIVRQGLGNHLSSSSLGLDNEGYDVGALAGFTLTYVEKRTDWFQQMNTGATPAEILFAKVIPVSDIAPVKIADEYKAAGDSRNKTIGESVDPFIENYKNADYVRVSLSGQMGSFSSSGFFRPIVLPSVLAIQLVAPLTVTQGSTQGKTMPVAIQPGIIYTDMASPCDGATISILVPRSQMNFIDSKLQLNTKEISGTLEGTLMTNASGTIWFCSNK